MPLRQPVISRDVPGSGPSERISGKAATIPKMPAPAAKRPPSILRRLTTTAERSTRAADMASRSSGVEASVWRSSTKGPWGMRYLPQAVRPKPEGEQAGAERAAEGPGAPVLPVGGAGHAEEDDADEEDEGDDLLGPVRVLRRVAHVRVAQGGDRHRHPGARGLVVRVAHERSPIQKQMRARPPTPMSRATKPSATGPTPPSAEPAGVVGCCSRPVTYETMSATWRVGQVAREARHVGRPGADRLGHLLRGHLSGSAATGRWCRRPARHRIP